MACVRGAADGSVALWLARRVPARAPADISIGSKGYDSVLRTGFRIGDTVSAPGRQFLPGMSDPPCGNSGGNPFTVNPFETTHRAILA